MELIFSKLPGGTLGTSVQAIPSDEVLVTKRKKGVVRGARGSQNLGELFPFRKIFFV